MQKKVIKLFALMPNVESVSDLFNNQLLSKLETHFSLIWSNVDYSYLIVDERIYTNPKLFRKFVKLNRTDSIKILFMYEASYPDFNIFDYAITFDSIESHSNRVLPINGLRFLLPLIHLDNNKQNIDLDNRKFCNFIYSNPNANPFRDILFDKLNLSKKVDSLGMYNNNQNQPFKLIKSINWRREVIDIQKNYKFSLSIENTLMDGYTSEKLTNALLAGTIPIYWGNPLICQLVNTKRIINCHDYDSVESVVNKILEIDSNNKLYNEIIKENIFTDSQLENLYNINQKEFDFWYTIFHKNMNKSKKVPIGTFVYGYKFWFSRFYLFNTYLWRLRFTKALVTLKRLIK